MSVEIIYFCRVNLFSAGGKGRATRQKLEALDTLADLKVFNSYSKFILFALVKSFYYEILFIYFALLKSEAVIISRGGICFFAPIILKLINFKFIREVHSDSLDEFKYMNVHGLDRLLTFLWCFGIHLVDKSSENLIVNNPALKKHFEKLSDKKRVLVSYNGWGQDKFEFHGNCTIIQTHKKIEKIFSNYKVLVFTGSVSPWHGVESLLKLSEELQIYSKKYRIIVAGGSSDIFQPTSLSELKSDMPANTALNLTPADTALCSSLIKSATACVVTLNNVRVSPGSPLKLYDYFWWGKPVIVPEKTPGYSDEVQLYTGHSLVLNFNDLEKCASEIHRFLTNCELSRNKVTGLDSFSWTSRMASWVKFVRDI
jgi:glycosyltransferase involved in cell wall biosynthesis